MKKLLLSSIAITMLMSSCVNDKTKKKNKPKEPIESVNISISADDKMRFNKTELKVKEGHEVTLILIHTGKMLKDVMGHNFVLLKKGTDIADFASKALQAVDNGYIPQSKDIIANTKLIGGGESVTITFIAPAKGTYDFICSFPGHYGVMNGKFIVE